MGRKNKEQNRTTQRPNDRTKTDAYYEMQFDRKKNTVFFMAINLLGGSITIQMNANGVGSFFSADPLIIWFGYITINNTILHVGN